MQNFETSVAVRDFSDTSDKSRKRKIGVVVVSVILLVAAGAAIGIYFGVYNSKSSSSSSNVQYGRGAVLNATLRSTLATSVALVRSSSSLPSSIDLRSDPTRVGPIKNQEQCGCCWAFSTSDVIEGAYGLASGQKIQPISVQQIVSCDSGYGDQGCNGGDPAQALQGYLAKNALASANDYPYSSATASGTTGSCSTSLAGKSDPSNNWFPLQVSSSNPVVKVTACSTSDCLTTSETSLMTALYNGGIVSICVDANNWNDYTSGIVGTSQSKMTCTGSTGSDPDTSMIDHAVSVVGYNTDSSGNQYWIVRNQWGTSWGINGYIYLKRGQNTCCILCETVQTHVVVTVPTASAATTAAATTAAVKTTASTKTTAAAKTTVAATTAKGATTAAVAATTTAAAVVTTTAAPVDTSTTQAAGSLCPTDEASAAALCSVATQCTNPVSLASACCACYFPPASSAIKTAYAISNYGCAKDSQGYNWCCYYSSGQVGIETVMLGSKTLFGFCFYSDMLGNQVAPPSV